MSLSTNLLGYWRCANGDDEQGSNDGTLTSVTVTSSGKYGSGWSFNSSTAKVDLAGSIDFTASEVTNSGYTISVWVKGQGVVSDDGTTTAMTSETGGVMPMTFKATMGPHFRIGFHNDSGFTQSVLPGGGDGEGDLDDLASGGSYWADADFDSSTWYHWTCTVINGAAKYYLNGVHVATATPSSSSAVNRATEFERIGNLTNGWFGKNKLAATVDDVAIWGRVLTDSEIASVYGSGELNSQLSSGGGIAPSAYPSQIRAVVQFTGSYGPAGVYDEYGAIATGSIVANDLNDVLSHMASSIKRIHLNDNLDFTYGAAGNIWKHPRPNSDGAHDLGTQSSPWSNLIIGNVGRGIQFGSSQDVKLMGINGSGIEVFADADDNGAADTFEFRSTADLVLSSSTTVSVKTFGDNRVLVASGSSAYSTFLSSFSAGSQSLLDALSSLAVGGGRIKEVVEISSSTTSVTFSSLSGLDTSPDDFEIFVNGTLMREGSGQDYEAASSDTLTFAFTLEVDDIVTGCKG